MRHSTLVYLIRKMAPYICDIYDCRGKIYRLKYDVYKLKSEKSKFEF